MSESSEKTLINTEILPKDALELLLKGECHRGDKKMKKKMAPYVFRKSSDGESHIFDLNKTWQKIRAAARFLVTIEDRKNICLVASTQWAKRSIFKFSQYTGSYSISGRFTPGTFTNQICSSFREPSVLISCDPDLDRQAITEASYVNVPVIALCNTNTLTENVDLVIPCNNKSKLSVAPIFYLLSRELLRMSGKLSYEESWEEVKVDLFIFKAPKELEELISVDRKKRLLLEKKKEAEAEKAEDEEEAPTEAEKTPASDSSLSKTPKEEALGALRQSPPEEQKQAGLKEPLHYPREGIPTREPMYGYFPHNYPEMNPYLNPQMMNPYMPYMNYGAVGSDGRVPQPFAQPPPYRGDEARLHKNQQPAAADIRRPPSGRMEEPEGLGKREVDPKLMKEQMPMMAPMNPYSMPNYGQMPPPYMMPPSRMSREAMNEYMMRYNMERRPKSGQQQPMQGYPMQQNFNPSQQKYYQQGPSERAQPSSKDSQRDSDRRAQ